MAEAAYTVHLFDCPSCGDPVVWARPGIEPGVGGPWHARQVCECGAFLEIRDHTWTDDPENVDSTQGGSDG